MSWSVADCESVAKEFAEPLGERWNHVRAVGFAGARLMLGQAGRAQVVGAAWLHDIGYTPKLHRTGMHAIDGALFLDLSGAPKELVSLVAFHTGAEYEADERGLTGQLIQFDRPPQDDLDALILADLTTGPSGQRMTVAERIDDMLDRYEARHPVHRAVKRSRPYLEECAKRAAKRFDYPM